MAAKTYGKAIVALVLAAFSSSTALSVYLWKRKSRDLESKIQELEKSLKSSVDKCAAERQGRIRAQQALREKLVQPQFDNFEMTSYPMTPIGTVQSCFSTRNGTPRQPLLVPLARACLVFNVARVPPASLEGLGEYSHCWIMNGTPRQPLLVPLARACLVFNVARVPPASLEGLGEYSHCWIMYIFHLNTDIEKLWKNPTKSKFKAKVRVPRLKGGRMGVFATRSPYRPCPIGLTVAKVESVQGHMVLLSGVDLVDGTPVLDVKPYIPYCDSIQGATVPQWLMADNLLAVASVSLSEGLISTLADFWQTAGKKSLYASPEEFLVLIKQVLSWDIRSVSQRSRPHASLIKTKNGKCVENAPDSDDHEDEEESSHGNEYSPTPEEIIYHLILEAFDISYRIDTDGNVLVEKVELSSVIPNRQNRSTYLTRRERLS